MPSSDVQERFPSYVKESEKQIEEANFSRETARNVATLAEWEDDFDSIISQDDNGNVNDDDTDERQKTTRMNRRRGGSSSIGRPSGPGGRTMKRGRRRTPHKRPRKERRRESSLFSREGRSLLDDDDDVADSMEELEDENERRSSGGVSRRRNNNGLPFSVTINPEEYTSPSISSTSVSMADNDSVSTLGTPAALRHATANNKNKKKVVPKTKQPGQGNNRESLDSACISPSSLKSSSLPSVNNDSTMVDTSFESIATNDTDDSANNNNNDSNMMMMMMPMAVDTSFDSIVSHGNNGRESNDTTITGKETPNSARTSSSTILRAVHASGALMMGGSGNNSVGVVGRGDHNNGGAIPSNSGGDNGGHGVGVVGDQGNHGRLRPNQLRYSPSSSSGSSSTICPGRMVSC